MKSSKEHPEVPAHLKHIWDVVDYGEDIPSTTPVTSYWSLLQRYLEGRVITELKL